MSRRLTLPLPENFADWESWASAMNRRLSAFQRPLNEPVQLPIYDISNLPATNQAGMMIMVSGATGGDIPAFSTATAWLRVDDSTEV